MLAMLRDLVAHNGHANAALLTVIRGNEAAASDPELLDLLHHVLLANRFWLLTIVESRFVFEEESRRAESFHALLERYAETHARQSAWIAAAGDADLDRVMEHASIPGGRCTVGQALVQVCLHSHGHRAQGAKLLRRHGGSPPVTDFIAWLPERPAAEWAISIAGDGR